jgi:hypothetical protein
MDVWLVHVHKPNGDIRQAYVLHYDEDSQELVEETVNQFGWRLTWSQGVEPGGLERWEAADVDQRVRMSATKVEVMEQAITLTDQGVTFED